MMEGLSCDLQNLGVPADHIKTEGFGMAVRKPVKQAGEA